MKVQSLSVVVPNRKCINDCAFCVSKMHTEDYPNYIDNPKDPFYDLRFKDYLKRLEFARDNGCNTVMLTGNSEPQQNRRFLTDFGLFMAMLDRPFRNIEMQTTGVLLDDGYLRFLRNHVGVTTISVSVSAFDDDTNERYCGMHKPNPIDWLCEEIKRYGFNLRLSVNLTDYFDHMSPKGVFEHCSFLQADQVTFRVLYVNNDNTPQGEWVREHRASAEAVNNIRQYIIENGTALERLEFGSLRYSVDGLSTVLDDDCMNKEAKDSLKYLILRPDCKLYSKWDDKASLIF